MHTGVSDKTLTNARGPFAIAVVGTLKGYDQLVNIVLEDTVEFMRDPEDPSLTTNETRALGLVVCRGNSVMLVCPAEGYVKTTSPFEQQQQDQEEQNDSGAAPEASS
ncbi:U6 snRNA-associated Sm-like protein LSm7 [Hondaea fermentalgiana]|uniref:U6 snRNA-associated Sm-like protein LSm7 n=1 Tax=Hondaea fermentalgiana TaxID=2315210 RepID=A0A2R5GTE0_9STRA|nr:U6 snRNA-associated Sm-like protein LSm7 [Hondaea fermentalgiana]|eukprot:GBG34137.1 U6 snRNA-associated Sm-like protein LSm7 [Hondaea fermentalgiana]